MPANGPSDAGLLLGSNISPETNLPAAVARIGERGTIVRVSNVWQTAPVGFADQRDFCNAAVLLKTALTRDGLRQTLRAIEDALGRVRDPSNKNAPRTIDIDIVVWESEIDPEVAGQVFAAVPLAEVLPDAHVGGERLIDVAGRLQARDAGALRLVRRPDLRLTEC
jgi:2-amino-4-hydroxy-6-hydroxymethyldihydropteridine diphosphokinase